MKESVSQSMAFSAGKEVDRVVSAQMLKKVLKELHEIMRVDLCLWDRKGSLIASTFSGDDLSGLEIDVFFSSAADSQVLRDFHFFKVYNGQVPECVLVARGSDAYMAGRIAVSEIQNLMLAYHERLDKNHFIQNLLMDNLLATDIQERAKKLHIEENACRAVYLAETKGHRDSGALETARMLFGADTRNFVVSLDEHTIVIVKELTGAISDSSLEQTAHTLVDTLNAEAMTSVRVAYGNPAKALKSVSQSFKEARMALEVGKIFYTDRTVVSYGRLGLGRLIYQLPVPLCELFIKETFKENIFQELDDETLMTIRRFFENDLNISETARQMYVHRNTLVYRLEKLEKTIGLDIRKFEEALTFKIAMMVESYLKYTRENP